MKAAIYTRVSTAGQEDNASLETQVVSCQQRANELGYEVTRIAKEVFSGAYLFERPILSSIRDEIRLGLYDVLIIHSVDRLSRRLGQLSMIFDDCLRYNTQIIFVTEPFEDTPEGRLLLSVRAYVAEIEREKIKERSLRGKWAKAKDGTISIGHKVYGYDKSRRIIAHEADVIKKMYQGILSGESMRSIATQLDIDGIASPRAGQCWMQSAVRRILQNPIYTGRYYAFRYRYITKFNNAKLVKYNIGRPQSEWVLVPNTSIEPIIDIEQFEAVQLIIAHNKKMKRKKPQIEFLLRGRITCGVCGRTFTTTTSRGWRAYICDSRRSPLTKCGCKQLHADKVEAAVWDELKQFLKRPERVEKFVSDYLNSVTDKKVNASHDLESLSKSIAKIDKELNTLASRAADDAELWDLLAGQMKMKQAERSRLSELRTQAESIVQNQADREDQINSFGVYCEQFKQDVDNYEFTDKLNVLDALDVKITWNGEKVGMKIAAIKLTGQLKQRSLLSNQLPCNITIPLKL